MYNIYVLIPTENIILFQIQIKIINKITQGKCFQLYLKYCTLNIRFAKQTLCRCAQKQIIRVLLNGFLNPDIFVKLYSSQSLLYWKFQLNSVSIMFADFKYSSQNAFSQLKSTYQNMPNLDTTKQWSNQNVLVKLKL